MEKKIPLRVEACCLNTKINMNSGMKRKQADDMIIDDEIDLNVSQKKTKVTEIIVGMSGSSVEVEVGEHQPRPALLIFCVGTAGVWATPGQFEGSGVGMCPYPLI